MEFDQQLRRLWRCPPLSDLEKYCDPGYQPNDCYLGRSVGGIEFYSFISEQIATLVELDILLLSASSGSRIVTHGGDIDNRLKTLLDALKAPTDLQQIPKESEMPSDKRMFCVMDDDKLISRLSMQVDRLLTVDDHKNESLVIVRAKVIAAKGLMSNIGISL